MAIPFEHRADEIAVCLLADMPWMGPATEQTWHAMRASVRHGDIGPRLPPMLLVGPPGISPWGSDTTPLVLAIYEILAIEAGLLTPPFGLLVYVVKGAVPEAGHRWVKCSAAPRRTGF